MPERYGRQLANRIACNSGNEDCIRDAIKFGSKDVKDEQRIPPGLEEEILCNYFRHTEDQDEFINVFNRMNRLYQPSESRYKSRLINALTCTKNPEYLYEFLETSLGMHNNNVNYTRSEKRAIFNGVVVNPNGMDAIFELIENYQGNELTSSYGWSWSTIFKNIADSVYTDIDLFRFLEHMSFIDHTRYNGMLRQDIGDANKVADQNLNDQKLPSNSRQMDIILELLEREFLEITTITEEPTTQPTTSEVTTTSTDIPVTNTTTVEITTTTTSTDIPVANTTTEEITTTTTLTDTPVTTTKTEQITTTTITEESTTPPLSSTTPDSTTRLSTSTEALTTISDSASSIKISIIAFLLAITLGIVMQH